jgi:hypothetical protein
MPYFTNIKRNVEDTNGRTSGIKSLVFCVVLPRAVFVNVVTVLPFTGFDYPFGVFKLFFTRERQHHDQVKKRDKKTKMVDKTINRKQRLEQ